MFCKCLILHVTTVQVDTSQLVTWSSRHTVNSSHSQRTDLGLDELVDARTV